MMFQKFGQVKIITYGHNFLSGKHSDRLQASEVVAAPSSITDYIFTSVASTDDECIMRLCPGIKGSHAKTSRQVDKSIRRLNHTVYINCLLNDGTECVLNVHNLRRNPKCVAEKNGIFNVFLFTVRHHNAVNIFCSKCSTAKRSDNGTILTAGNTDDDFLKADFCLLSTKPLDDSLRYV